MMDIGGGGDRKDKDQDGATSNKMICAPCRNEGSKCSFPGC